MQLFDQKLLSIAREVSFRSGERLLRQGEAARGAFVLREGQVEAQVALPGGGMLAVAQLGAGDMFGEMALIERGVCSASVVACSEVAAWFIDRGDFRAMVASRDSAALQVQRAVTRVLAQKLRALNAKVREHQAAEDLAAVAVVESSRTEASFDWRAFLPVLPFFEGFDAHEIGELIQGCSVFELPRGAPLFAAGEPADACFLVVRGALEILSVQQGVATRVAVAGPGELVGYLSILEGASHTANARTREHACLLELSQARLLALYNGDSGTAVRLQHAIHRSLLKAIAHTNTQLARLITAARLRGARVESEALEAARSAQIVATDDQSR